MPYIPVGGCVEKVKTACKFRCIYVFFIKIAYKKLIPQIAQMIKKLLFL